MQDQITNAKKIAFIIQHVSDAYVQETVKYLSALRVPDDFEAEIIPVAMQKSVAAMNNIGMQASDAKYKVYLRPGTVILHENFIADVVRIFQADAQKAMLGIHGTRRLATSARWKDSVQTGKLLFLDGTRFNGEEFEGDAQEVMVLSGELVVTQYDLPWREDLFTGFAYCVEGQCVEFRRKGKTCAVVQQKDDWAVSEHMVEDGDESRNRFLDEYSKDIYPLVLILCMTHNRPEYFKIALDSAIHQTYRNLDIFITDDSSDTRTKEMIEQEYHDSRIHYEYNPGFTAVSNHKHASEYDNPKAEFINWLMDDDYFMPNKIERMIEALLANPSCTLCTSYRIRVDEEGRQMPDIEITKPLSQEDSLFDGDRMGLLILKDMANYIGEPTTVLYRKSALPQGKQCYHTEAGTYGLGDILRWAQLLAKGNCYYIVEPLSAFRIHKEQLQQNYEIIIGTLIQVCFFYKFAIDWSKFLHTHANKVLVLCYFLRATSDSLLSNLSLDFRYWNNFQVKRLRKIMAVFAHTLETGDFSHMDFDIDTDYEVPG